MKSLIRGKVGNQFPANVRSFALTLHFYSPRGYEYVRSIFKELPATSTIRKWYSSINGNPGYTQEALDAIRQKVEQAKEEGKELLVCLMCDEMAIRKQIQWNDAKKEFCGYVNYGTNMDTENLPIAKEALLYLVSGIIYRFKIPVAYFLLNGLNAEERASLTKEVILFLCKCNVKVVGFTFDGLAANISMCRFLGADFSNNESFIKNPHDKKRIYIFLDACHMEKLARNCIASKKTIFDNNNDPIQWKFFEELEKIQRMEGFQLANKINKTHIQWQQKKMSVRLAVETLSESVALSMEQLLKNGNENFNGCEATIKFILYMNNILDALNVKNINGQKYKRPLMQTTHVEIFDFFEDAIDYIKNLKLEKYGKSILETKSKTAFFGFMHNMNNFIFFYKEYVSTGILEHVLTFRFSQDHLETFFSCIRSMNGCNNNPNTEQFAAAYRKLLLHNEIKSSADANCRQSDVNILTVSSRRPKLTENNGTEYYGTENAVDDEINLLNYEETLTLDYVEDSLQNHAITYIASSIEKKVVKIIKCQECIQVIEENDKSCDSFVERKSTEIIIKQPCDSTVKICKISDKILSLYKYRNNIKYAVVINEILKNVKFDDLYEKSDFHIIHSDYMENHKYYFVKLIIEEFVKFKFSYAGKCITSLREKATIPQLEVN